jgi:parallel beta-helix repeat protein
VRYICDIVIIQFYEIFFHGNISYSIARNNYVYNSSIGITVSESPNNHIYNNTIEGATSQAIRLFIPPQPQYDGFTENNSVYNNTIVDSENGIAALRSHDNILESNTLSNIQSSDYLLSEGSNFIIRGQNFDNAIISHVGSGPSSDIEIVDSGIIEVAEEAIDDEDEEFEGVSYNTDVEPYSSTLSNGYDITVDSP